MNTLNTMNANTNDHGNKGDSGEREGGVLSIGEIEGCLDRAQSVIVRPNEEARRIKSAHDPNVTLHSEVRSCPSGTTFPVPSPVFFLYVTALVGALCL